MKRLLMVSTLVLGTALLGSSTRAADGDRPSAPLPAGGPPPAALTVEGPAVKAAAPGAPVVVPAAPVVVAAPGCAPACETACLKKVCVPESATRVVRRRVYGEACEDFCLPKCSLTGGLMKLNLHHDCDTPACGGCAAPACGTCGAGGCANCDKPRVRKFLVVKIRSKEECYTKCGIALQPAEAACETKCHTGGLLSLFGHKKGCEDGGCATPVVGPDGAKPLPAVMPPAEKLSAPKTK